eukprot:scaffold1549_cov350-Prasinococcus_capsulatus_cf.AAC.2
MVTRITARPSDCFCGGLAPSLRRARQAQRASESPALRTPTPEQEQMPAPSLSVRQGPTLGTDDDGTRSRRPNPARHPTTDDVSTPRLSALVARPIRRGVTGKGGRAAPRKGRPRGPFGALSGPLGRPNGARGGLFRAPPAGARGRPKARWACSSATRRAHLHEDPLSLIAAVFARG